MTHNKRLSYLKINKLIIIGCYFPYQSGQPPELRADNENEYYQTIANLNILLESLEDDVHELIVLGDFNTDFNKHISRSSDLLDMCVNHSLTSADINKTQIVDYTYFKVVENGIHLSWIDHAFVEIYGVLCFFFLN